MDARTTTARMAYTVDELAALLGADARTIRTLIRRGEIGGAFRLGRQWRIARDSYAAWQARQIDQHAKAARKGWAA